MNDQGRRKLGAFIGVCLAGVLLPGIILGETGSEAAFSAVFAFILFGVLTNLIAIAPSSARPLGPPPVLLMLAAVGLVQDFLIWLLASWAGGAVGAELRVEGIGTMVLAAVITRASIWATLLLLPGDQAEHEPVTD